MRQQKREWADHSLRHSDNTLEMRLEILREQLSELETSHPHNRMDPMYDRYFSGAEYYTDEYGPTESVQNLREEVRRIEMKLLKAYLTKQREEREVQSILKTGATSDGQIAMIAVFLPEALVA